jgi:hypothetical protein
MSSASQSGWTEPRNVEKSKPHTRCKHCWGSRGRHGGSRCVGSAKITVANIRRGSMACSPSRQPDGGAWPNRFISMAKRRRGDAPGYPSGAVPTNAPSVCQPNTKGRGRRECAKPWNQHGKRSCRRIPLAFAPDAPVGTLAEPSSTRSDCSHSTRSSSISPAASTEHLNTPVNNPPVDDLAEVEVTDPSHPLYGRRFALLSTRPCPHSVGYIFVAYRDTMVLRIPQGPPVWSRYRQSPNR